jgi:orotate phosphoribosyltransferase
MDIAFISGIPRSGVLAAHILALHRNISCQNHPARRRGRLGWQALAHDKAFLIDDSVYTGDTLRNYLRSFPQRCITGAVYATESGARLVDVYHKIVNPPRAFEWNIFHCNHMHFSCLDLDGVLCVDPTPEENDDGPRYAGFVKNARPLFLPSSRVHSVVTNRLEKYREPTEAWLSRHHVNYGALVMSRHSTRLERIKAADYADEKANYYRKSTAYLFIESNLPCAKAIRELSGKAVLCTACMSML